MQNDNVCINCGDNATHYHHVVPKVLGGNDTTNVVPLCDKCHGLIHSVSFENGTISHSQLTKIGLQKAREKGIQLGNKKGIKLTTKKSLEMKEKIIELNYSFNGSLSNEETYKKLGIARNTFYKYKKEIAAALSNDTLD